MSLKQIKLAPQTISDMYTAPLFMAETAEIEAPAKNNSALKFLGSNNKSITILVNEPGVSFLGDQPFNFLTGILSACKLSMADVALLNLQNLPNKHYQFIETSTRPVNMLLFNVACNEIGLPLQFPHFQIQKYNNISYLSAPDLGVIEPDKAVKAQLWGCLKSLFQL